MAGDKLNISGKRHVVGLAYDEIVPQWAYKEQYTKHLNALLEALPNGTLAQQSVALYRAAENAKATGHEEDYRVNRAALSIIRRAEYIEAQREQGVAEIGAITDLTNQFDTSYSRAAALATGKGFSMLDARQGIRSVHVGNDIITAEQAAHWQKIGVPMKATDLAAKPYIAPHYGNDKTPAVQVASKPAQKRAASAAVQYAAADTPRELAREGQAYLQLIDGVKYTTGRKNSACPVDGSFNADLMDGICREKTDMAIRQFQKDHKLPETGKFDEKTMAELKKQAEPKLAALKTPAVPAAGTAAPATQTAAADPLAPSLKDAVAAAMAAHTTESQEAINYSLGGLVSDQVIRGNFIDKLKEFNVTLTEQQLSNLTVTNGIIASPDIAKIEQELNKVRGSAPALTVDGKWDERLAAIVKLEGVGTALGAVFHPVAVASNGAPAATPPATSGGVGSPAK